MTLDIAKFVQLLITEGSFAGCDLDGGWVQGEAVKAGILVETKYDPAIHGTEHDSDPEPGDPWYEFSPEFKRYQGETPTTSILAGE